MANCKVCGKTMSLLNDPLDCFLLRNCGECGNDSSSDQKTPQPKLDKDLGVSDETLTSDHLAAPSNDPNTLGCFYEWILNSTIIFAACAFVISLFSYFTADNPIAEQINMGTLLISGTIVGLLTAMKWLMGAMSTHLANQAKIIELMNKKDGDE